MVQWVGEVLLLKTNRQKLMDIAQVVLKLRSYKIESKSKDLLENIFCDHYKFMRNIIKAFYLRTNNFNIEAIGR